MASYFVVQSFSNGAGGLSPDSPIQAQNLHQARRLGDDLPEEVAEMERV